MVLDKALKVVAMAMIVISSAAIVSYSSQAMGFGAQSVPKSKITGNIIANDSSVNETAGVAMFTEDEISSHNSQDSCWMIIDGNVYDVTSYMPMHPVGGPMMQPYCGKDATSAFASIHSANAYSVLNDYYIGRVGVAKKSNQTADEPIKKTMDVALINKTSVNNTENEVVNNVQNATTSSIVTMTYTSADVALHNSQSSCWMTVDGGVYDVTTYIPYHPEGSSTILPYCGRDATSIFASIHTSAGYTALNGYKIGTIGTQAPVCTPSWSTGTWSTCTNGYQNRTVTDLNSCGIATGQPSTIQACTIPTNTTQNSTQVNNVSNNTTNSSQNTVVLTYTFSNVSLHSIQSDCWMIVGNGVYNVTSYLPIHPAGPAAILPYCGTNATALFASVHTSAGYTALNGYFIGNLTSNTTNVTNNQTNTTTNTTRRRQIDD